MILFHLQEFIKLFLVGSGFWNFICARKCFLGYHSHAQSLSRHVIFNLLLRKTQQVWICVLMLYLRADNSSLFVINMFLVSIQCFLLILNYDVHTCIKIRWILVNSASVIYNFFLNSTIVIYNWNNLVTRPWMISLLGFELNEVH